jgi:hypothetical protein
MASDIPQWALEKADELASVVFDASVDLYEIGSSATDINHVIARALLEAEARGAERMKERAAVLGAEFIDGRLYKPKFPACSYHAGELATAIRNLETQQ